MLPETFKALDSQQAEEIAEAIIPEFRLLLQQQGINWTARWGALLTALYLPLASFLVQKEKQPHVVGINGAQGSGKSTLTLILAWLLKTVFKTEVTAFSIDDFYLTREQRLQLAEEIHPLFMTRGVPGTHDAVAGCSVLDALTTGENIKTGIKIPRFDKAADDRMLESDWQNITRSPDIILFEGWCVGCDPESPEALLNPVNELEAQQDSKGIWRQHINSKLESVYCDWFGYIDTLLYLQIPAYEKVLQWRELQESRLPQRSMSHEQLAQFVMHFERLTRHCMRSMPQKADLVLALDAEHFVHQVR